MATNKKDDVYIRSGETLKIEVVVRDADGNLANLIGASAKFGIAIGETITIKDCVIEGSIVTAILTDEETATLDGNYKYEIVLQTANGEKKSLAYGIVVATKSMITEIFTEGV